MNTLTAPWRQGVQHAWASLAEGWRDLRRRAGGALTRFRHDAAPDNKAGAAWGLVFADLRVEDDRIIVRMELPGMNREDLQIDIDGDLLSVSGEKRIEQESGDGGYRLMQCAYGSFRRDVSLPHRVDAQHTQAHYRNGVLRIDMPRVDRDRGRRIPVHGA
ncbi:Hsp20/alpha crystallin family protein [Hydrogenophaga sp. PBL-H3]|uniref:Hsp20/alpha crystallin family protein n=1 Tax=Hydrogenophaga sp. PBL-H3 TaxID=434010 RepID=UPI0013204BC1|nr:Hsp20/alpha crystallin family protein [Hydrogenophaga sp. PBL-H3]QHE75040.1 Hsp20/alpha crystallin family protein [Hydrogenophaga sp. PBL-H3]QHE79467.1 Hsp20/alpha crystallin family protein [Hydrogenophaga sp. PBL-H3]